MDLTKEELEQILPKLLEDSTKDYSIKKFKELFSVCRLLEKTDKEKAHKTNKILRKHINNAMRDSEISIDSLFDLYKKSLLFDAQYGDLDAYMLYLEINRKPSERFYQPRRKQLKVIVDAIQELLDGKLDELFLTMPPRVGKTTIMMMTMTLIIGKYPEKSNLYSAYSDTITNGFFKGILEIITDDVTYTWKEIFPKFGQITTSSNYETVDIGRKKRYPSITCRAIEGTLNGACDCNGFLVADDIIGGYEQAINTDRLTKAWGLVNNNLIPRAKEQAKKLWCGTRWSVIDPAGMRLNMLQNDEAFAHVRYRIVNTPALDENDESNFDYDYGVGFSTEYFRERRASFEKSDDMPSFLAQYQQTPIERQGNLFPAENFRYFNGTLPEGEPDRIFMAVDPAYGGGDYVASPVCFQYGDDIFVKDVVYSNADKYITQPMIANAVQKYGVQAVQIEANRSTIAYKEGVDDILKERGIRINLTTKAAPTNLGKDNRIKDKAPEIKEYMIFLDVAYRSKDYGLFMQNVFGFKLIGRNAHDDAPDSLAMAMAMARNRGYAVEAVKRPF